MLSLNLVPQEQRTILPIQNLEEHPFFATLLGISGPGGNPLVGQIAGAGLGTQAAFMTTVAQAHSALRLALVMALRRVAELSVEGETIEHAKKFYDFELGRQDSEQQGTSRLELFRGMIESLLPGLELPEADADQFRLHRSLKLNQASLAEALAVCEELEIAAPAISCAWQDFVAQWQVFQGVRTESLDLRYVEGTPAGDRCETMLNASQKLRDSVEYTLAREKVRNEFTRHLDEAMSEVASRLS